MMILIGTDDGLVLWRVDTAAPVRLGESGVRVRSVALTGTERFFAVLQDGRILSGELGTGVTAELSGGLERTPRCIATQGEGLYVGTEPPAVYRYDTTFKQWELLGDLSGMDFAKDWTSPTGGPTVRSLAPHSNIRGGLYANIHVGGIVRTLDGGLTWESVSEGLEKDVHQVTATPARPDNVYAATADGFYRSRSEGDRWDRLNEGLENLYCRAVAVHSTCPEVILISGSPTSPEKWESAGKRFAIFRSEDAGKSWARVVHGLPSEMPEEVDSTCLAFSTLYPERAFCARRDGVLYQSVDTGLTWDEVATGLPRINAIAAS